MKAKMKGGTKSDAIDAAECGCAVREAPVRSRKALGVDPEVKSRNLTDVRRPDYETIVGFGGTAVNRDLTDTVFKSLLRSNADVGSLDFEHRWANRQWLVSGAFSRSLIEGSTAVIQGAQQSSARYYQRPDANYLSVDPSATSLTGYSTKLGLVKSGTWSFSATAKDISPGYEVNDLGFMGRVDYRNIGAGGSFNNYTPGKLLRSYSLFAGSNHAWNHGGDKIWTSFFNQMTLNFTNLWSWYAGTEYDPSGIDDRLTRGGPRGRQPTQYGAWTEITTDKRSVVSYDLFGDYYGDEAHGYAKDVSVGVVDLVQAHQVDRELGIAVDATDCARLDQADLAVELTRQQLIGRDLVDLGQAQEARHRDGALAPLVGAEDRRFELETRAGLDVVEG